MRRFVSALLALSTIVIPYSFASAEEKGGTDFTGPYDVVPKWPLWAHPYARPGLMWGSQGGVYAEAPDRVFLANRGEFKIPPNPPANFIGDWSTFGTQASVMAPAEMKDCIVIVDHDGKLVESWTQWDYLCADGRGPHSIKISPYDPEHHVWVIDDYHHQIFKFTNDGKRLVMTLGERDVAGEDGKHFRRPTDIDWLPDGTFFVSDGYGNTRVAKFDKDGKFLLTWGKRGSGPGEFNTPHGIAVGPDRRVYVSDRGNKRIQVFDENGKFIEAWPNIMTNFVMIGPDAHLWAYDFTTDRLNKYDLAGHLEYSFGGRGNFPGAMYGGHQFSVDPAGNLYVAEVFGGRTQKFQPRVGADQTKLVFAPRLMPMTATAASMAKEGQPPSPPKQEIKAVQIKGDLSGTWTLANSEASQQVNPASYATPAKTMVFKQGAGDLAQESGPMKVSYKLDGTETMNDNFVDKVSGASTKTWVTDEGGKLHLYAFQGLNHVRDTITANGNTLTIRRDVETPPTSYSYNLTYTKAP